MATRPRWYWVLAKTGTTVCCMRLPPAIEGIENLALIPGTVGAAPVQNIGAYGTELQDTLVDIRALDRQSGNEVVLTNSLCHFSYRDSVFKHEPGRYVITEVRLRLSRTRPFSLDYRDLL